MFYKIDRIVRHSQYNAESQDPNNPPNMYSNDIALVHIVPDGKPVPIDSRSCDRSRSATNRCRRGRRCR